MSAWTLDRKSRVVGRILDPDGLLDSDGLPSRAVRRRSKAERTAASPTLESAGSPFLVKDVGSVTYVATRSCRCVACSRCNERVRSERGRWLTEASGSWDRHLLTLTVDMAGTKTGRGFESSEAAYREVHGKRYVSRLMKAAGVERWACVLEFHKSEVPHWHVMFDGYAKISTLRRMWCDKWAVGHRINVERERRPGRLARYLTSYLGKANQPPAWVLNKREHVRFISAARCVLGFEEWRGRVRSETEAEDVGIGKPWRTMAERLASCGQACISFVSTMEKDGSIGKRFSGDASVTLRTVIKAAKCAGVLLGVEDRWTVGCWSQMDGDGPAGGSRWYPSVKLRSGWRGCYVPTDWYRRLTDHLSSTAQPSPLTALGGALSSGQGGRGTGLRKASLLGQITGKNRKPDAGGWSRDSRKSIAPASGLLVEGRGRRLQASDGCGGMGEEESLGARAEGVKSQRVAALALSA